MLLATISMHRCPCDRENFSDVSRAATWKANTYTRDNWPCKPDHILFEDQVAGPKFAAVDSAHTLCKGVLPSALGSLLKEVIYEGVAVPGASASVNAAEIWRQMHVHYRDNNTPDRMTSFDVSHIVTNTRSPHREWPNLNAGSMSKARCLVPFGLEVASKYNTGTPRDEHRQSLFECFHRIAHSYFFLFLQGPKI